MWRVMEPSPFSLLSTWIPSTLVPPLWQNDKLMRRVWNAVCLGLYFLGLKILTTNHISIRWWASPRLSTSLSSKGVCAGRSKMVKCTDLLDGAAPGRVRSHIGLFTLAAHDSLPTSLMEDSIFCKRDELICLNEKKAAVLLINPHCNHPDMHNLPVIKGKCTHSIQCTRAFAFQISWVNTI